MRASTGEFPIRVSSRVLRYCSCDYDLRFPETCPVKCPTDTRLVLVVLGPLWGWP